MEDIKRQLEIAKSNGSTKLVIRLREKVWRLRDKSIDKSKPPKPKSKPPKLAKGKGYKRSVKKNKATQLPPPPTPTPKPGRTNTT